MEITVSIIITLLFAFMIYHVAKREIEFWSTHGVIWNDCDQIPKLKIEFHDQFPIWSSEMLYLRVFNNELKKEYVVEGQFENGGWTSNKIFITPDITVLGWRYKNTK